MANDMDLQLSFSYSKKELDALLSEMQKEVEKAEIDPDITGDVKAQLAEFKKQINSFAKSVQKDFDKISAIQLDSKAFEKYTKTTDKRLSNLEITVSSVIDTLSRVDNSTDLSKIGAAFDTLRTKVQGSNDAILELLKATDGIGTNITIAPLNKEDVDNYIANVKELSKIIDEIPPIKISSDDDIKKLKDDYIEADIIVSDLEEKLESLGDNTSSREYLETEKDLLTAMTKRVQLAEQIVDQTYEHKKLVSSNFLNNEIREIQGVADNYEIVEEAIQQYIEKLKAIRKGGNYDIVPQENLNVGEITNQGAINTRIKLRITTTSDEMYRIIKDRLDDVQKKLRNKAIIVPIRYSLRAEKESSKDNLALTDKEIKEAQKSNEEIFFDFGKQYEKIRKRSLDVATKQAKDSIKEVQNTFDSNPIHLSFDIPEVEKEKLASVNLGSNINIVAQIDKMKERAKELAESLEEVQKAQEEVIKLQEELESQKNGLGKATDNSVYSSVSQENADKNARKNAAKKSKAELENEIKEYQSQMEELRSKLQTEIFDKKPLNVKLEVSPNEIDSVRDKIEKGVTKNSFDISTPLKEAQTLATEVVETLNALKNIKISVGGSSSVNDLGNLESQLNGILGFSKQIVDSLDKVKTAINGLNSAGKNTKQVSTDFGEILQKMDSMIAKADELANGFKADISAIHGTITNLSTTETDLSKLETTLTSVWELLLKVINSLDGLKVSLNNNNLNTYESQWKSIVKTFHSVADYADDIDLRKNKQQLEEMLRAYKKYKDEGGSGSFANITDNIDTLNKLQEISYKINGTGFDIFKDLDKLNTDELVEAQSILQKLDTTLSSITSSLQSINGLDKVSSVFKALAVNDNSYSKIERLPDLLKEVAEKVHEIDALPTSGFIEQLSKITAQADGLTALADVLRKSQKEIEATMRVMDENSGNKSLLKEQIKIMEKYQKQYDKALNKSDSDEYVTSLKKTEEILGNIVKLQSLENVTSEHIEEARQYNTLLEAELTNQKNILEIEKQRKKESEAAEKANQNTLKNNLKTQLGVSQGYERNYSRSWGFGSIEANYLSAYSTELTEIKSTLAEINVIRERFNSGNYLESDLTLLNDYNKRLEEQFEELAKIDKSSKNSQRTNLINKIGKYLEKNTHLTEEARKQLSLYLAELSSKTELPHKRLQDIAADFNRIQYTSRMAGREGTNFLDAIRNKLKYGWAESIAAFFSFYDIVRYIREVSGTVTELNSSLIELAKVSDTSIGELYANFGDFRDIAKDTGGTINDIINATASWSRNGFSLPESKELARLSSIFQNIGDGITADQSNEYLVSILKGFNLEAKDTMSVMDSINNVANNAASSVANIGEALERSSSAFGAANTDLNEAVALLTTSNEVLQNPETVGGCAPTCTVMYIIKSSYIG